MKDKSFKKNKAPAAQNGAKRGKKRFSIQQDPFFDNDSKRRRNFEDDNVESSDDDDSGELNDAISGKEEAEEMEVETAAEKRKRIAEAYLEEVRAMAKREEEEEDDEERESEDERAREGERDSRVANILQQEQLEDSGRVRRLIASRYLCANKQCLQMK